MNDGSISTARLLALMWWAITGALVASAWITWSAGAGQVWALLGFTGCTSSAAAAVAHIRYYETRLATLVRLTSGLTTAPDDAPDAGLRLLVRSVEL